MAAFKTHNFLPEVFRTDTNKKFLNATLDQLTSEPNFKKVSGYIGRKFAPTYKVGDGYVAEPTELRQHYQVEPGVIVNNPQADTTDFYASYPDLINKIAYYGGNVDNQSRLFSNQAYSYSGLLDLDKFVNFSQYYWLPNGPDTMVVSANGVPLNYTWDVHVNSGTNTYYFGNSSVSNADITLAYGGTYTFNLDGNNPFWIQTQPGVTGLDATRTNISTRDVFGVVNNGASSGAVTFNVPQKDTQLKFTSMKKVASVDYATKLSYKDIQAVSLETFNAISGLDGATGNIHNKTLIFVGAVYDDLDWTAATTRTAALTNTDSAFLMSTNGIDQLPWTMTVPGGVTVVESARSSTWLITIDGDGFINLSPQQAVNVNETVNVKSGLANATKDFYVDYYNRFTLVPLTTATLDTLYYQSGSTASAVGTIKLVQPINDILNPLYDIDGKKYYVSPNGVTFTNGLKITFDHSVTPEFANRTYYVSGVGKSIKLVPADHLLSIEDWSSSTVSEIAQGTGYKVNDLLTATGGTFTHPASILITGVTATGAVATFKILSSGMYSALPVNPVTTIGGSGFGLKLNLALQPVSHDYLTVDRASVDLNAWSRSNRWTHIDVIKYVSEFNGTELLLDQNAAAKRPIIEIQNDTKLFNHGTVAKAPIDVLDTVITNAFTQIEAVPALSATLFVATVAGETVILRHGDRVVFSNDTSTIVRNKIYTFSIVNVSNDPFLATYLGSLVAADDSLVVAGNSVVVTNNAITEFWFNGSEWIPSQTKLSVNQVPLFDAFDKNGISFGDTSFYTNTNFAGTPIFSYKVGTGTIDSVLGFPLSYRSFNNVGDIQFSNNFDTDTFSYLIGPVTYTVPINTGLLHITKDVSTFSVANGWVLTDEFTKQYQLISYIADGVNNVFEVDILPEAPDTVPNIKVLVNSKVVDATQFGLTQVGIRPVVIIESTLLAANDSVDILIYSKSASALGFYQVPSNLDNNAENANFATLTLGQMRNHLVTLYRNSMDVVGTVPGTSNLRDLNVKLQGGSILKHSAPVLYSELFLVDQQMNFVDAIKLAQREYSKFKNRFLELATVTEVNLADIPATADAIIKQINSIKNSSFPWYYSDMVPHGDAKTVLPDYAILDPRVKSYQLTSIFDDTVLSNKAVLVYISRTVGKDTTKTLLAKGRDYSFNKDAPSITIADTYNLNYNDILSIVEYSNTDGNFVPETPSKLGLFPKFTPAKYLDNTYVTPNYVIQGHDGSLTPAFNDYRDDLLLELEMRIYNNIKAVYDVSMHADHTPGKFRNTDYNLVEYNQILSNSFLTWVGANRLDFTTNKFFQSSNPWTWNYKNFRDTIDGEFLPGSWRAIFMYYYDTMRPHTHPWEMLGFSDKPTWWQDRYGPAPYTGGNLTLWTDLSLGYIHAGDRAGIDATYARPGLLSLIPVDDAGNLLSPEKYAVLDFDGDKANASFAIGDVGPAEAAWRKSSDYAYAVQIAMALTKPAMYFGLYANVDRYGMDSALMQYVSKTTNQHLTPTSIEVNGDTSSGSVIRTAGYLNWISDYLKNLGIGDPQTKIKTALKNVSVQLNYKVAGYTDKKFLKILAEQGSPSSTNNSIVIPDENYKIILNKSVPVEKIVYSAVIVEKSAGGYTVSGYDLNNPYFTIIPSQASNNAYSIKAGDLTGTIFKDYYSLLQKIAYGYEFTTTQEVVDFLVSYQRSLQSQGFIFIDLDLDLGEKKDWVLSAKEFLTWAQQGWAPGNVLVLSPIHTTLRVSATNSVVDEIVNTPTGSKLLDPNFGAIKKTNFTVVRADNDFTVNSFAGQTIALAELSLVQYEHVIIFDNTTVFNDIIYSADTGNRQYRLKFVGYKTANWSGVLNPPGFVYNDAVYDEWKPGVDYRKGQLVTFKDLYYTALSDVVASVDFVTSNWKQIDQSQLKTGLMPNFANNAKVFETIYDVDNQPFNETVNFYSNGLVGFRERNYLTDLLIDAETQVKFYQGYIKQKGTLDAVTALSSAEINGSPTSINVYEEWALRVGEYGATESNHYAEVILNDLVVTSNPAALQFLNDGESAEFGATPYYPMDIYRASKNNSPEMFDVHQTSADRISLPVAGYPRIDDVDATIFDFASYRNLSASIGNIGTGYTIWTAKDFDGKWNVYRVSETGVHVVSLTYSMDNLGTVTTNGAHNLAIGDVIALKGFSYTVNETLTSFDGFYQVYDVVDNLNFTIALVTGYSTLQKAKVIYDSAMLFKLSSSRLQTVADIQAASPLYGWTANDNLWVDNATSGGWGVYRRNEPWAFATKTIPNISEYYAGTSFGKTIKASKSKQFLYVGSPDSGNGRVSSFVRQATGEYIENASWVQHSSYTSGASGTLGFGSSLDLNDRVMVVGASNSSGELGANQGHVYIYKIENGTGIALQQVLVSPLPAIDAYYGAAICSSNDGNWLYISEPGLTNGGLVHIYQWVDSTLVNPYPTINLDVGNVGPVTIDSPDVLVQGGAAYILNIDYTISGNTLTFIGGALLAGATREKVTIDYTPRYVHVGTLSSGITAADNFGNSINCDLTGRTIIVGAKNAGTVYVFDRSVENFVMPGTTNTVIAKRIINSGCKVLLDGAEQTSTDYMRSGQVVQFFVAPAAGTIVSVENNQFSLIKTLTGDASQQFGSTVIMCDDASSMYVAAPALNGAVHKFTNPAKLYGTITGSVVDPVVTNGSGIRINNVDVTFGGTTLLAVIDSINSSGIPGITASNVGGKLKIASSAIGVDKFNVLPGISRAAFDALGLDTYPSTQVINHPVSDVNEKFGVVMSISEDENTLAISSDGATTIDGIVFDSNTTDFDSGSTVFSRRSKLSGAVYVFDLINNPHATVDAPSVFEFTQVLKPGEMNTDMLFGASVEIMGKSIFVGSAGDKMYDIAGGSVLEFFNAANHKGWQLIRTETPQVDYSSISKAFIYNKNTQSIIARLDIYDPAKGKILGVADQDLDFKSEQDPATYNNGIDGFSLDFHWSDMQIGKTWWDLSQVRFVNYEQGSLDYKNTHWGNTFPGSKFKVYEWTASEYIPSQYVANGGNGVPKYLDDSYFATHMYVDKSTNVIKSKYYYWVGDKTTVDTNLTNRTNSVYTTQQILSNPRDQDIPYIAAIAPTAVSLFNVNRYLVGQAVALHIDHTPIQNTNIIHTEYELVKENTNSEIPHRIIDKLQDSLSGINFAGHAVPDPALSVAARYGIDIRPRQTMFVDRPTALANFVKYINTVFKQYPIANLRNLNKLLNGESKPAVGTGEYDKILNSKNERNYILKTNLVDDYRVLVNSDSDYDGLWTIYSWSASKADWTLVRIQSYLTSLYFEYIDWYDASYSKTTIPTYTVASYPLISKLSLKTGDVVKVLDDGNGKFAIYRATSTLTLDKVASEEGTIQILPTLYDLEAGNMGFGNDNFDTIRFDQNPILETRDVFSAVADDIFVADLQIEFNKLFFSLVNYIYTEQSAPDWIFKTSFLSVVHNIRELAQYPSYIKDNQTYYEDYINEVKPYRTIIREYLPTQSATDYLHAGVTDFDLPSYYDTISNTYRSPSGEQYYDAERLTTDVNYADWNNNHTYKVVEIEVSAPGDNYTTAPIITISGGGGTGATAKAVQPVGGKILTVTITNPGSGYTSIPTVSVNGNGEGLVLVPLLRNEFKVDAGHSYNTVRGITTELKFDRITYDTNVVQWEPNTEYVATLGSSNVTSGKQYLWTVDAGHFESNVGIVDFNGILMAGTSTGGTAQVLFNTANSAEPTIWLESGTLVAYNGDIYLPVIPTDTAQAVTIKHTWDAGPTNDPRPLDNSHNPSPVPPPQVAGFTFVAQDAQGIQSVIEFSIPVSALHDLFDYSKFVKLDQGNVLITNNDRIAGYYTPGEGMPGNSLTQLVNGIEYPGVTITGSKYSEDTVVGTFAVSSDPAQHSYSPDVTGFFFNTGSWTLETFQSGDVIPPGYNIGDTKPTGLWVDGAISGPPASYTANSAIDFEYYIAQSSSITLDVWGNVVSQTANLSSTDITDPTVGQFFQLTNNIVMPSSPTAGDGDSRINWLTGKWIIDNTEPYLDSSKVSKIEFATAMPLSALAIAGNQIDSTIASAYKDVRKFYANGAIKSLGLGERPEDILIDGGAYYDAFSSHAPEEMMPGRVYETLDIQVLQANTNGFDTNVFTISSITVQDVGYGYDDAVSIADKASKGVNVTGIVPVQVTVNGINDANLVPVLAANGAITSFTIVSSGTGLTVNANPEIVITGTNIAPAHATAILSQSQYELIGWRDFYDMNGAVSYTRILPKYTTTLTQDLHITDTVVHVDNVFILSYPSVDLDAPGRVFINGELITFYGVDEANSTLTQIRRAAEGTGGATLHVAGSYVVDAGGDQIIPGTSYIPDVTVKGGPEIRHGDNVTTVFETHFINTIYPQTVKVTVAGKNVTNFEVIQTHPVKIKFVRIGANPYTPGFIPAAPALGAEIIISAKVEGIWENVLASDFGAFTLTTEPGFVPVGWDVLTQGIPPSTWDLGTQIMDGVTIQTDPALVAMGFSWNSGGLSGDYLGTVPATAGAITDGGGLMLSTTIQSQFIRGEI
jgi:hypothetical protein